MRNKMWKFSVSTCISNNKAMEFNRHRLLNFRGLIAVNCSIVSSNDEIYFSIASTKIIYLLLSQSLWHCIFIKN